MAKPRSRYYQATHNKLPNRLGLIYLSFLSLVIIMAKLVHSKLAY